MKTDRRMDGHHLPFMCPLRELCAKVSHLIGITCRVTHDLKYKTPQSINNKNRVVLSSWSRNFMNSKGFCRLHSYTVFLDFSIVCYSEQNPFNIPHGIRLYHILTWVAISQKTLLRHYKDQLADRLLNCCWPSPTQWFLVPSSGLTTIFYCLTTLGGITNWLWLMLFRELSRPYSENHTKYISLLCGQCAEIFYFKLVVHTVTTVL
jgi:hypothetical protein